jgi:hypothetical protein
MGDACELAKILDGSLELLKTIGDLQEPDLTAILAASKAEIEGYVEILRVDGETPASSQTPSTSQITPATVPASHQEPQLMKPLGELSNHTIVCLPSHVHQPVAQPANGGQLSRQMRGSRNRQPLSSTQVPDSQPVDLPLAVNPCRSTSRQPGQPDHNKEQDPLDACCQRVMDMVAALPPHSVSDSVVIIEGQPHYVADKSAAEEALFARMFIGVGPVDNGVLFAAQWVCLL